MVVHETHNVLLNRADALKRVNIHDPFVDEDLDDKSGFWTTSDDDSSDGGSESSDGSDDSDGSDCSSCSSGSSSSGWSAGLEEIVAPFQKINKSISSPAIAAMNTQRLKPLISKSELNKQKMMRVESSPFLQNMDGAPDSLKERMRKAELVGMTVVQPLNIPIQPPMKFTLPSNFNVQSKYSVPSFKPPASKGAPVKAQPVQPSSGFVVGRVTTAAGRYQKQPTQNSAASTSVCNPETLFRKILEKQAVTFKKVSALQLQDFFLKMTDENISAYNMTKTAALRTEDIKAFRRMLKRGENLQVCNRFGESMLHAACRRGSSKMLKFFMQEAGVSVKVIDDYGRTVMHDACWAATPNFEVVDLLVNVCPDLFLIADKRGSLPLQYVRRDHWGEWCKYLEKNAKKLIPKELKL